MRKFLLTLTLLVSAGTFAQQGVWKSTVKKAQSEILANKAGITSPRLFELDQAQFTAQIAPAPERFAQLPSKVTMTFPGADGVMKRFVMRSSSTMDPQLASRFPEIKSYVGKGIDDPASTIYVSVSPLGIQAMIIHPDRSATFIEPYTSDNSAYISFRKADRAAHFGQFECRLAALAQAAPEPGGMMLRPNADDGNLRNYRLAVSVTGEYTAYFGGTKAAALAAINATMTRVNAIFEMDFGVTMTLIPNNDVIIYTSAASDPYSAASAGAGGAWNQELQTTLTNVIGNANYDIGHLFGASGGGGNAGCIGCVCRNPSTSAPLGKGSAYTSPSDGIPMGDTFDVDYVAHEMGHQFGANHTFTFSNEGTGAQMEPGSGSTIMGYAGITGATNDVQSNSDPYFHAISIQQVTNYVKTTTCQTTVITNNAIPTANAGADFTIPKGTPFMLTGSATDANNDALTFTWEQMNTGTSTSTIPSATRTTGPAFRSFGPSSSPSRSFPRLSTVQSGLTAWKWEVVPTVARTMNFRFTVRDNRAGGPANNSDDMVVTVNATAGPFTVSAPNTAVSFAGGSTQTVTWNVAGTTANGVNCSNVDILLSTDGGNTFPITLLTATPNDGSQAITIPNQPGATNRIMVRGSNHIFYDMSNVNFTITAGSTDTTPPTAPLNLIASGTTQTTTNLTWTASTDNVAVTGYDVFRGTTLLATVTTTNYTVSGLLPATTYSFTVRARDAANNVSPVSNTATVTTLSPPADTTAPTQPLNLTASGTTQTSTVLSWTASTDNVGVSGYDVLQGNTVIATVTGTSYTVTGLTAATTYTFTVRAKDAAGNLSPASNTASVTTLSAPAVTYCGSQGNSVADERIQRVQFAGINNPSTGGTGYTDFTAISTNVNRGSSYTITITPQWTGTVYNEGYAVWIDYNRDGDFADTGERVFFRNPTRNTPVSGTVTIPTTAAAGPTRMRVSMKYNALPTACEVFAYGQVEDYTVIINAARETDEPFAITLFPNPVQGNDLHVSGDFTTAKYRIVNMLGQVVAAGPVENNLVPVASLSSGTYILEVTEGSKVAAERFIRR